MCMYWPMMPSTAASCPAIYDLPACLQRQKTLSLMYIEQVRVIKPRPADARSPQGQLAVKADESRATETLPASTCGRDRLYSGCNSNDNGANRIAHPGQTVNSKQHAAPRPAASTIASRLGCKHLLHLHANRRQHRVHIPSKM